MKMGIAAPAKLFTLILIKGGHDGLEAFFWI
jgi:hypothetical protein